MTASLPVPFIKMHGLGNDFVVLDARDRPWTHRSLKTLARRMCDRHFGIGADGLIYLQPAPELLQFGIYNPDGSEAETCGNGLRCAVKYYCEQARAAGTVLKRLKLRLHKTRMIVTARVFWHKASVHTVEIDMGRPEIIWQDRPWRGQGKALKLNFVSMGNPHCVVWAKVSAEELSSLGPRLEKAGFFPEGANIEFAQLISNREAEVKVWERGAGVTLACGSGACAVFAQGCASGCLTSPSTLKLPGGALELRLGQDGHIYMRGPAQQVFRGEYLP